MRALLILIVFAAAVNIAAAFAGLAGVLQQSGSAWANAVGFSGLAVAAITFLCGSIWIWRNA